jgi:hypothetical protein
MKKLNLIILALVFGLTACKPATPPNSAADTTTVPSTTTNTVSAPTPTPAISEETPEALKKYELLKLPFKLDRNLGEGDLDQMGWAVGTKKLIKTNDNFYAVLHCLTISGDDITFELYGVDKSDALVGKKRNITYLLAMASAETQFVTTSAIDINDKNIILDIIDSEGETETKSSKSFIINANGVD